MMPGEQRARRERDTAERGGMERNASHLLSEIESFSHKVATRRDIRHDKCA